MNLLFPVLLVISLSSVNSLKYNADSHSYEDLLVAISPDIDSSDSSAIITNIQSWITSGSQVLYTATHGWAYIKNVKILLPANWDNVPDVVDAVDEVFEDSEIRVDTSSPIYGDAPFTIQTGGCGDPGEYIQVSHLSFGSGNSFSQTFGPLGQVFVHEWSKFMYGVFEEFGYPGDPRYPMFFYKQSWTASGETNTLTPNFCTNYQVTGNQIDMTSGATCNLDPKTGLPDDHCAYVVNGPEEITSSIMAVPYLAGNHHYCEDNEELLHNDDIPTKHNDLCQGRSVFSVIKDNADFANFDDILEDEKDTTPTFTLLRPRKTERLPYVLVLDASNSMQRPKEAPDSQKRINRLKQAATRFVDYTAQDGIPLGVVRFSAKEEEETKIIYPVTPLDGGVRQEISKSINDLELSLYTCLGLALRKGLEALRNYGEESGGVMLFLTDGQFACKDEPTINDVIDEVLAQNVRVITVAFGADADYDLENLAAVTNGQSFFVPDYGGPEDLNIAFSGSLNYQPSGPMGDKEVIILQETAKDKNQITTTFTIGKYEGKDVIIQIDIGTSGDIDAFFSLDPPQSTDDENQEITTDFYQKEYQTLPEGDYEIKLSSTSKLDFVTMKVTSKSQDTTLPLYTECWSSAGDTYLDLVGSEPDKLVIMARVMQGQNPVIGAEVTAYIDTDNGEDPVVLELIDEGQEPDNIKGDGIYSRYFTQFVAGSPDPKRYTLKCEAVGGDTAEVNLGFIQDKSQKSLRGGRSLPAVPSLETPICCGSTALREDSVTEPTGKFTRNKSGGLISVSKTQGMDGNLYPPGRISDLSVGNLDFVNNTFDVSFTSAGDDLDQGTVDTNEIFFSSNMTLISGDVTLATTDDIMVITDDYLACTNCSLPSPQPASSPVVISLDLSSITDNITEGQLYFRIQATDQGGKMALSNVARIFLTDTSPPPSSANFLTGTFVTMTMLLFMTMRTN